MARLIVLDASVVIAALARDDVHHRAAVAGINSTANDDLVLASTTRTEVLIHPARVGGSALANARALLDGCATVPVTGAVADDAALLKARHPTLRVPDAITLVVAEQIEADAVWTFDRRWTDIDRRATVP